MTAGRSDNPERRIKFAACPGGEGADLKSVGRFDGLQVRILCAALIFYVRGVIGITAVSKTARLRFESIRACYG